MHFTVITDHSALKALRDKSILTGRLLRRAEKLLEYNFDIVCCSGKGNVVPYFLLRIYLVELNSPGEDEKDQEIAKSKNKIFVPFANRSCLLEKTHRTYTGHLRTANLFSFKLIRYFWSGLYKDVENVARSCLTCARIHSTIDYRNMKLVVAVYPSK